MKTRIGEKIRQARVIKNLSQENVAIELGISTGAYSNIERGKSDITVTRLLEIVKILGVSPYEILNDTKTKSSEQTIKEYPKFNEQNLNELRDLREQMNLLKKDIAALKKPRKKK